ncbi:enoyl-CoA hydratase/carnithine racemase-like [Bacillus phage vB_BmeM-Goe8]|uniref:Protein OPG091 n=1 Tax=Bacillus phage vB_BmeM-Goe8 TaxID=2593638 RepID=A0A516KMQ0_9CAUD|nr:enoyl-CoA hydratase/carnithine racemase-like [Bacillus phage vB_BmeM-Goe8]QDP42869.1 putative papain-like amidase enzyme [Bacillus phage vB_BmeM-Goe8]
MVKIEPGDVIFYRPTGFIGWLVSKITKSEYSHVSLAIDSYNIVEADRFIKSRISNLYFVEEVHKVYRLRNVTSEQQHKIVQNTLTMVGAGYDYKQIYGLFMRLVFKRETSVFNTANKYICSEIIDYAFQMSDIPRSDQLNVGDITPQELLGKYVLERVK